MPWMPDQGPLKQGKNGGADTQFVAAISTESDIKAVEKRILSSTEHLNEILNLLALLTEINVDLTTHAVFSLSRIFRRLRTHGKLELADGTPKESPQGTIVTWLNERYEAFVTALISLVGSDKLNLMAMTSTLGLVRDETKANRTHRFANRTYTQLVERVLEISEPNELLVNEFVEKYLNEYYDLQYYFLLDAMKSFQNEVNYTTLHTILSAMTPLLSFDNSPPNFFTALPSTSTILLPENYKVAFQSLWLHYFRHPLAQQQLKQLLLIVHKRIIPYMNKPPLLMDWLTDAYNSGGSISLLALNGLWELMQNYNLDYPEFFVKLYALFTPTLFHTRYLARFLRLSDLFLSSTYLPATLVASFLKRLSRLSLTAPPHGIVAIIPMTYNLLKRHPTCMQMIHRPNALPGRPDSFDPFEPDPLKTGALQSSLWELASMTQHYNSNISSLAKILSEPFSKPAYNLEDFLDHSYGTMLDADLRRRIKKDPAINHEKPQTGALLEKLWDM